MKCLDDCHTYELDFFLGTGEGYFKSIGSAIYAYPKIHFYEMREDGTKIDGVTNEEVIKVLIHRIKYLNSGKLLCTENSIVIGKLEEALMWLDKRTADRISRKVEATHNP